MKEGQPRKVDPISERINKLPYMVQGYLSMGKVKQHPDTDETTKRRLSSAMVSTFKNMTLDERVALHSFGAYIQDQVEKKNNER